MTGPEAASTDARVDLQNGLDSLMMTVISRQVAKNLNMGGNMKRTVLAVVALLIAFGMGMLAGMQKGPSMVAGSVLAAPAPAVMTVPIPPRCPAIHEAIGALEAAERDMREARHDFCGHKREAMEVTHHAIEQLRAAEGCDRCR
jgi:hypothetical protein